MKNIEIIILLLSVVVFLSILASKVKFPVPILLVLVGLLVSFIPFIPFIELEPEVVFLIFLPPLLYEAAWNTSWHEFKSNLRPITLAGVGLVFFTTTAVAILSHWLIPSFSWPESFLLGAIVSPPDAVAAVSVTKGLGLHKRVLAIIEGESLVNDASGLVAYKYAVTAVATGTFVLWKASLDFVWISAGGILIGLAIGYVVYLIHKYIVEEPLIETVLTFLTPYTAYLLAEHFHLSGVLAVVAAGLFLSSKSHEIFSPLTRMNGLAVWQTIVFVLNGLVFILIGLELRHVLMQITTYSVAELMVYGLLVSLGVIVIRFVWVFPAAYLPRILSKKIREREYFSWKNVVVFSWTGMRGVVSMAAALALPLMIDDKPFPNRDIIIFLTFGVVIFTLIVQGISLPYVIKLLRLPKYSILEEEFSVRFRLASESIVHIEENLSFGLTSDDILAQIKSKYELKINKLTKTDLVGYEFGKPTKADELFNKFVDVQLELLALERETLKKLQKEGKTTSEVIRKIEHELDLEQSRLEMEKYSEE